MGIDEGLEKPKDGDATEGSARAQDAGRRSSPWLAWLVCVLAITFCTSARILGTLGDANFRPAPGTDASEHARGLLRSDPGLLFYITERIIEADGGIPADFHADGNVEHPDEVDLARMFTVGEEFLVAWAYLAFGGDTPLHVFAVYVLAILAALTTLGVFGAARELTGSWGWAACAAVFYVGVPINYRTYGFIFIREDLSIPLFAFHAWALFRLARRPSVPLALLTGLFATLALATWHAMGFVVALELAALSTAYLASGRNPFVRREAWWALGAAVITSLFVPVLRAKLLLLSLPALLIYALALSHALPLPKAKRLLPRTALFAGLVALLAFLANVSASALAGGAKDYGHVIDLMLAKLRHLGQLPADPTLLSFDTRLLWQGPFSTALPADFIAGMPHALIALGFAVVTGLQLARKQRLDMSFAALLVFSLLGLASGAMIRRTLVLAGLAAPVALVTALQRNGQRRAGAIVLAAGMLGAAFTGFGLAKAEIEWYRPAERGPEIRALVDWVADNTSRDEAILGDFVTSTALLAHTRNPIALQPKYETESTRRRIERFYETFARGTPAEMHALAREFDCQLLLVDTEFLWAPGRYILGVPLSQQIPDPGTSAYAFLNRNPAAVNTVPGFELVYGSPRGLFRLYRVR